MPEQLLPRAWEGEGVTEPAEPTYAIRDSLYRGTVYSGLTYEVAVKRCATANLAVQADARYVVVVES